MAWPKMMDPDVVYLLERPSRARRNGHQETAVDRFETGFMLTVMDDPEYIEMSDEEWCAELEHLTPPTNGKKTGELRAIPKEMKEIECAACGSTFLALFRHKRYCSPKCRNDKRQELMRAKEVDKKCCTCGCEFTASGVNRARQKFCSLKCKWNSLRTKKAKGRAIAPKKGDCAWCGSPFTGTSKKRFCSKQCRNAASRARITGNETA